VEVRAAGIEIAARDLSSSSFIINPHHHPQTLTSWNSLSVCGRSLWTFPGLPEGMMPEQTAGGGESSGD